jgi:hypothetical protein
MISKPLHHHWQSCTEKLSKLFVAAAKPLGALHSSDEYKIPNLFKKLGILTVKVTTQRGLP